MEEVNKNEMKNVQYDMLRTVQHIVNYTHCNIISEIGQGFGNENYRIIYNKVKKTCAKARNLVYKVMDDGGFLL